MKPLAQALTKFGLSEYESTVYLTLMKNGKCSIKDIAAKSMVPRTKIYPVLKNLEKRHLVSFVPGKIMEARGLAPDSSLTNPIKNMEQDLKLMKKAVIELRKIHESSSSSDQLEMREYWITRNQEEAIHRFNEMISNASDEILLAINHEGLEIISKFCYDSINLASKSDVPIKIMINATKQDAPMLNRFSDLFTIKFIPFSPENNMMLIDGKELFIFKKMALIDSKSTTIVAEYYNSGSVGDFLRTTISSLEWSAAKDMGTMMPVIQNSWLPENFLMEARVSQIYPILCFQVLDSYSTRLGAKLDSALTELGRKTLESIRKTSITILPPNLSDALGLLSSLYLLYEGVQPKFTFDAPLNLITCELSGELTPFYKMAAERGFKIPPSVWGFFFLGLLDVFGYDASVIENAYNSSENYWLLQYKLSTKIPGKVEREDEEKVEEKDEAKGILPKIS